MKRAFASAGLLILLLGTGACGSLDLGSLGGLEDILGSTGASDDSDVVGTVQSVNTSSRTITLDVQTINQLRDARPGSVIYYDGDTVVVYEGNQYRPEDLERGDQIAVDGSNRSGRFYATRIEVLRDTSPY